MDSVTVYVAKVNADQTEGRGGMIPVDYYLNDPDAATKRIKGQGVMGVGDGEVDSITFNFKDGSYLPGVRKMFYGYRKVGNKWGYGYVDEKPNVSEQEEYDTWVRLNRRFGR